MKTLHIFKKPALIALCILGITSCEKSDSDIEAIDQEGFMSTTGNSNTLTAEDQSEAIKPIFHMSFGAEVSKEEAIAKFEKALAEHRQKIGSLVFSGPIIKVPFRMTTTTGMDTNEGTNGAVKVDIVFKTDKGRMTKRNFILLGDRELGTTDYYALELTLPKPIGLKWMEVESATIKLKGTNGWRFTYLSIYGYNEETSTGMNFNSKSGFKEWLDASCNTCWDDYTTDPDDFTESGKYRFE